MRLMIKDTEMNIYNASGCSRQFAEMLRRSADSESLPGCAWVENWIPNATLLIVSTASARAHGLLRCEKDFVQIGKLLTL